MQTFLRSKPGRDDRTDRTGKTFSEHAMPIFEYLCDDCGTEFEELVFDRDECPPCPKCASTSTSKLMSAVRSRVGGSAPDAGGDTAPAAPAASGCAGCSGGNCSSCH
jgi:putative FmdB family regulatory protein